METNRPLVPGFLNRLDRKLLLNRPELWSARTHLVLYYSLLFIVLLTVLALIAPDDPRTSSGAQHWVGFVSLISFIAFVVWAIYLLRFNVFKRFGSGSAISRLSTFALYFVNIGCFVFFPFVKPLVEVAKANIAYSPNEMKRDVDNLNMDITRLYYDSLDHKWTETRAIVVDSERQAMDHEIIVDTVTGQQRANITNYISREDIADRISDADSVVKVNNSTYLFFECPNYIFTKNYSYHRDLETSNLTSSDIYRKVILNYKREDPAAVEARIRRTVKKYTPPDYYDYRYYGGLTVHERIDEKYHLVAVGRGIDNIYDRKYQLVEEWEVTLRIFIYTTIFLTLLLFTFRHSTPRAFFLALLTGVILTVLTALMMAFSGSASLFFVMMTFYFFIFTWLTILALQAKTRNTVTGISINLFLWMLPFIPLCLVAAYYEGRNYYVDSGREQVIALQRAEWIGLGALLIALVLLMPKVYRRWWAAPEE
jgi:hypothetical protein